MRKSRRQFRTYCEEGEKYVVTSLSGFLNCQHVFIWHIEIARHLDSFPWPRRRSLFSVFSVFSVSLSNEDEQRKNPGKHYKTRAKGPRHFAHPLLSFVSRSTVRVRYLTLTIQRRHRGPGRAPEMKERQKKRKRRNNGNSRHHYAMSEREREEKKRSSILRQAASAGFLH